MPPAEDVVRKGRTDRQFVTLSGRLPDAASSEDCIAAADDAAFEAFVRVLKAGAQSANCAVSAGRTLASEGKAGVVARALTQALDAGGDHQDHVWSVADGVVASADEVAAAAFAEALSPHLPRLLAERTQHIDRSRGYHRLGRWRRVFPAETMRLATDAYPHEQPPLLPHPADEPGSARKRQLEGEAARDAVAAAERAAAHRPTPLAELLECARRLETLGQPPSTALLARIGEGHLRRGAPAEALKVAGVLDEKGRRAGRELEGDVYRYLGDLSTAAVHYADALATCGRDGGSSSREKAAGKRLAGLLEEVKYESFAAAAAPAVAVPAMRRRATDAMVAGEYSLAAALYSLLLEKDTAEAPVYHSNRSAAYLRMKRCDEALADAERVTAMKPNWHRGWLRKGKALRVLKRTEASQVCILATALSRTPHKHSGCVGASRGAAAMG